MYISKFKKTCVGCSKLASAQELFQKTEANKYSQHTPGSVDPQNIRVKYVMTEHTFHYYAQGKYEIGNKIYSYNLSVEQHK
jgi:hypothetical protein